MWHQTITNFFIYLLQFHARFGGGDNFSGGGGFGNGSGGDNGDLAILIFHLVRGLVYLIIHYPVIGIPLALIVLKALFVFHKFYQKKQQSKFILKTGRKQKSTEKEMGLNALMRKDPNFSQEIFLQRCQKLFHQSQKAWSKSNLQPIKNCLSSAVYERLNIQLLINKNNQCVNNIIKTIIKKAEIVGIHSDNIYDVIHIQFDAEVYEEYINAKSKERVKYNKTPFVEYWSFIRRVNSQTLQNGRGLIEGYCPNCGAQLVLNDKIDCQSCQAILQSGKYDWILAEISQSMFFVDRHAHRIPGVHEYKRIDQNFNPQHIEDLSSLIFNRYLASYYFSDKNYLTKHTSQKLIQDLSPEFMTKANGIRSFYHDAAVGSVEVIGLDSTSHPNFDFCKVKITWSGHLKQEKRNIFLAPQPEKSSLKNDILILKRKKGINSNLDFTLISNHCQGCGAPESHDDTDSCRYCGRTQNTGELDWILDDIQEFKGLNYQKVDLKVEKHINAYEILTGLIALAYLKGKIQDKEKKIIVKFAKEHGFQLKDLKLIFNQVAENHKFLELELSSDQYVLYIKEFIKLCIADGKVCNKEKKMIQQLLKRAKITEFDVNLFIERERKNQYQQAKNG